MHGYTLFFLFLLKNIDCGYSLEPLVEAVLKSTHNLCFEQKYEKYQNFLLFFLFLLKNIECGYSLQPLVEAVLTSTHNLCFEQIYENYQNFLSENYHFFGGKFFSIYLNRHVFGMSIYKNEFIDPKETIDKNCTMMTHGDIF